MIKKEKQRVKKKNKTHIKEKQRLSKRDRYERHKYR